MQIGIISYYIISAYMASARNHTKISWFIKEYLLRKHKEQTCEEQQKIFFFMKLSIEFAYRKLNFKLA